MPVDIRGFLLVHPLDGLARRASVGDPLLNLPVDRRRGRLGTLTLAAVKLPLGQRFPVGLLRLAPAKVQAVDLLR